MKAFKTIGLYKYTPFIAPISLMNTADDKSRHPSFIAAKCDIMAKKERRGRMRIFDYGQLLKLKLPSDIYNLMARIHEYKGKQELYVAKFPAVLEKMIDLAKIQSTKSSNAIEGIATSEGRLDALMEKKAEPRNRNEEEIYGYRAVLDLLHQYYENISLNKANILTLHSRLYSYSPERSRGMFKQTDNVIIERNILGEEKMRFKPVASFETEKYMDAMLQAYHHALQREVPPLLLIPVLIHDFLCIHPFNDGNGRLSRLLSLLLLYRFGFFVGRYISLEMLIEESKENYDDALQASSEGWHENANDELPFIRYMLSVILKAYSTCDERFLLMSEKGLSSSEKVMQIFQNSLKPLSKSDVMNRCPALSQRTIERALKQLQENKLLQKVGKGRSTKYIKA